VESWDGVGAPIVRSVSRASTSHSAKNVEYQPLRLPRVKNVNQIRPRIV